MLNYVVGDIPAMFGKSWVDAELIIYPVEYDTILKKLSSLSALTKTDISEATAGVRRLTVLLSKIFSRAKIL